MSDVTSTQVRVQIINKCGIKMVQMGLYNGRDPPSKGGEKKKKNRRNIVAI